MYGGRRPIPNDQRISGPAFREFCNRFTQLLINRHLMGYQLGGMLLTIRDQRLWDKWPRTDRRRPGYSDWAEWCDKVIAYSTRSADELIRNHVRLKEVGLDESSDTFVRALRLGWTKLAEVLRIAQDEDHLVEWLNYVDENNLTVYQLRARIAEARENLLHGDDDGYEEDYEEENEAEEGAEEEEDTSIPFNCRVPDAQALTTITNAIETVRRRLGEDVGQGRALAYICTHYLGVAPRVDEGGPVIELEEVIRSIEENYRVRLEVVPQQRRRRRRRRRQRAR